jgi:hypothetical protein
MSEVIRASRVGEQGGFKVSIYDTSKSVSQVYMLIFKGHSCACDGL